MSLREYKIAEGGTIHAPPSFLAGVRGPDAEGAGTAHEVRSSTDYAELSYTAGECPFIEGPITSDAGACIWLNL